MIEGRLGFIDTPKQGNDRPPGVVWCADNGRFGDGWVGHERWFAWLASNAQTVTPPFVPDIDLCRFATAPDVVGDADATLAESLPWLQPIRDLGYRAAFVAQNGATTAKVPWDDMDALFIGGSPECIPCGYIRPATAPKPPRGQKPRCPRCRRILTEWKEGSAALGLAIEAKVRGKYLHMGRVNGGGRWRYAEHIGCDSVDGTYLVFGPKVNLPKLLAWTTPSLFGEAS